MEIDIEKAEMRDVLRRCNIFISQFEGIKDFTNIPRILLRLKQLQSKLDIKKLFDDLKKYE